MRPAITEPRRPRRRSAAPVLLPAIGAVLAAITAITAIAFDAAEAAIEGSLGSVVAIDTPAYFPAPDEWERRRPDVQGMDPARLEEAVAYAVSNESDFGPDLETALKRRLASGPHGEIVGPLQPRGGPAGLIVRGGYIVAEWGNPERVDMTFSVTKSFLATVAGLAFDDGMIGDLHARVGASVLPDRFASQQNRSITWHHLLQQTSEWEGTLWEKPDVADRRRGTDRDLHPPGRFWEYNDVRVNLAALSLLHLFRRPLPEVLRERVMDPIGASDAWEWHGYRNSWVTIDGERMQSVSGGGHWGGGMWISALDMARFGYLFLRNGRWGERRIVPEDWIEAMTTPSELNPRYGYMWWLNTDREMWPSAPATSYAALGAGTNAIWIDPEHDLLVVVRWIQSDALDGLFERVIAAVEAPAPVGSRGP